MAPEVQAGISQRRALAHRAGHTAWVTPRKKPRPGWRIRRGNAERPERATKSPVMKAALVQANIRQVPAHVRWCQRPRGTSGKISAEIFTQME